MPTLGVDNFAGGITKRNRVSMGETAMLARCSGYDFRDGRLLPENVPSDLTTGTALTGTTAEQVPFAFVQDAATKIIARDSTTAFREHASGVWGSAGDTLSIVEENVPARVRDLIVYSSDGVNPRLMAYEPGSSTDKLRPLSLKGPTDYKADEKPAVTPSSSQATQLYDIALTTAEWVIADATYGSITNSTDKAVIVLDEDAPADTLVAKRDINAVSVSLKLKSFLVLDISIADDSQGYLGVPGLFANDSNLYPSGYRIGLYDGNQWVTPIDSITYAIPEIATGGKVHRVVINVGERDETVTGVGLLTDSFWNAPETGKTFTITLYSEDFLDNWASKGNWLMPAVKWEPLPWSKKLAALVNVKAGDVEVGQPQLNKIANPSFEDGTTTDADNWTETPAGVGGVWRADGGRSGAKVMVLHGSGASVTSASFAVTAETQLTIGFWWRTDYRHVRRRVTVSFTAAGGTLYWPGAATWDNADSPGGWEKWERVIEVPAGKTAAAIKIEEEPAVGFRAGYLHVDDFYAYGSNQQTAGSALVLQTFNEDGSDRAPEDPLVQYAYTFCAKDLLGTDNFRNMVSNPSDDSREGEDRPTFADPWRTYTVAITLGPGAIVTVASAPTAAGTGYSVDDILVVGEGTGGKVKVTQVTAGVVDTVLLIKAGTGYTIATGKNTVNETGNGSGCTVNITDVMTPIEEYGDYLTHALVYRREYDGTLLATGDAIGWGIWRFAQAVPIAASMSWEDVGTEATAQANGLDVPEEMEITNDYLGSGRYSTYADRRVYAACLDWDNENSKWLRPTAIAVSGYEKSWAYPTTVDENSLLTDGTELDGYAQTGAEVRGLVTRNDEKFVFLDNEFFLLRGDNPLTGWQFIRIDSVGLKDARTLVDCRGMLIWHDGHDFYGYTGGRAEVISQFSIDSTLIDFDSALGASYFDGRYVMYCTYDSTNCLLSYDVASGAWKIRYSDTALTLVGLSTDGDNLYGLTSGGNVFNLYGSSTTEATDSGTQTPTREVWTGYVRISEPGADGQVNAAVLDVETAQASLALTLTLNSHGKQNQTRALTPTVDNNTMRYVEPVSIQGDAMQLRYSLASITPPDIYFLGVQVDDVAAR